MQETTVQSARGEEQDVAEIARRYFGAFAAHDPDAMAACWAPDGVDRLHGQAVLHGPEQVRAFFADLLEAIPDHRIELLDLVAEGDRCAARWRMTGTFAGPGAFQGIAPTGARLELEGADLLVIRDGLITANDAYTDGLTFARQIGLMPPQDGPAELRLRSAFNARTRLAARLGPSAPEPVADGVWLVRGGLPSRTMNVFLIEQDGGVCLFDAGISAMTRGLAATGASMGGIRRVVLGHSHADHRGAAPGLGAPVLSHAEDRADAEGDGGARYFDFSKLPLHARWLMPRLLEHWDGGPVQIEGTLAEGDEVGEFRVVHLPGHAPGLIALFRDRDRLALTSDCFYTLDPTTGRKGHPRVPHAAFNADTEQARASIRKLAALEPAAAWPGHADPLLGDVRSALERAADST